jgi:type II secretory pathway component GspD/PulD (secretin)
MKIKLLMFLIILVAAPALISLAQTTAANSTPAQDAATNAVAAPPGSTPPQTNTTQTTTTQTTTTQTTTAPTVPTPTVAMPLTTMATTNTAPGEEVAEVLAFDDLPLPDAIRQLATLAGLNIQFDHRLDNPVDPVTKLPVAPPTVKEKWRNLTPLQALQALLDKYDWQMKKSPSTPVVIISAKEANAVEPKVMEVILLGYSEPTNIVNEVQKAMPAVTVIQDLRTHQVIVTCTEREMPAVKQLISRLDSATGQILIEAKIIETIKDINSAKGIDWTGTLQAQHLSAGNGLTGGTTTATTQNGNNLAGAAATAPGGRTGTPVTSIVNSSSSYVTTTLANTAQAGGVTISTSGGFNPKTAFLNADGVSAILEFLNTDADTKSIALPRTVSLDGQKTTLAVIQNIPIFEQQQSAPTAGAASGLATVLPNYEKKVGDTILNEVGFKLTVTPRIAGASNVLITVQPEISTVDTKIATSTLNGQVETSPIFDRRLITTVASVPSGYTLVLGGLDNDVIAKTYTKVPGLGDLPGIGSLFRSNTRDHTRDTILIFVTPTIIKESDFQPTTTDFLKSRNEPMPTTKDAAWDRGEPYDWTKPQSPVQPVYKP